jgi:hypothetical protein
MLATRRGQPIGDQHQGAIAQRRCIATSGPGERGPRSGFYSGAQRPGIGAPGKADRRLRRAPSPRQAGCARRICALGFKIGLVSPTPGRHRSRRSGARCFSPVRGPPAAPRSDAWRHCRVRSKAIKGTVAACPCQPPFHGLPVLVRARGHYTRHAGMCIGRFVRVVGRERDKLRSRELRVESRMSRRRF